MEAKEKGISITLNATSEFCRALGDIPTYGQSGNRNEIEKDELMVSILI
jgi:U4/U6.U5 tri-snRNP-associated protein 1